MTYHTKAELRDIIRRERAENKRLEKVAEEYWAAHAETRHERNALGGRARHFERVLRQLHQLIPAINELTTVGTRTLEGNQDFPTDAIVFDVGYEDPMTGVTEVRYLDERKVGQLIHHLDDKMEAERKANEEAERAQDEEREMRARAEHQAALDAQLAKLRGEEGPTVGNGVVELELGPIHLDPETLSLLFGGSTIGNEQYGYIDFPRAELDIPALEELQEALLGLRAAIQQVKDEEQA